MPDEVVDVEAAQAAAELERWLERLPDDIGKELATFGSQLASDVGSRQPFLTGTLAGSAELVPGEVDTFFGISLGREVAYAGWIEFGGSRGREYIPQGRTVYPTTVEHEAQFYRLAEEATAHAIDHYSWSAQPT